MTCRSRFRRPGGVRRRPSSNGNGTATRRRGGGPRRGQLRLIRKRLLEQAAELGPADALNESGRSFGGAELALIANERVRTEHNCIARDVVSVAGTSRRFQSFSAEDRDEGERCLRLYKFEKKKRRRRRGVGLGSLPFEARSVPLRRGVVKEVRNLQIRKEGGSFDLSAPIPAPRRDPGRRDLTRYEGPSMGDRRSSRLVNGSRRERGAAAKHTTSRWSDRSRDQVAAPTARNPRQRLRETVGAPHDQARTIRDGRHLPRPSTIRPDARDRHLLRPRRAADPPPIRPFAKEYRYLSFVAFEEVHRVSRSAACTSSRRTTYLLRG